MKNILLTTTALVALTSPSLALTRTETAQTAASFVNSFGVTLRISEGQDPAKLAPLVSYVHAHKIEDRYTAASALAGFGLPVALEVGRNANDATIPAFIAAAKTLPKVAFLVGLDEPDNYPITYKGVTCGGPGTSWGCVSAWTQAFYKAVKADATLKSIPVAGPSHTSMELDNQGLQFLKIPTGFVGTINPPGTTFSDIGNVHCWQSWPGRPPGVNMEYFCYTPYNNFSFTNDSSGPQNASANYGVTQLMNYQGYGIVSVRGLPTINNFGFHTDGTASGDAIKGSEDLAAIDYQQFFGQGFNGGVMGGFIPLVDTPDTAGRGLYADYTHPRPSATFIHNLMTWMDDVATVFTPGSFTWTVSGDDYTNHSVAFQKASGKFEILFWEEQQVTDTRTISWSSPHSGRVYDPSTNAISGAFSNVYSINVVFSPEHATKVVEVQ